MNCTKCNIKLSKSNGYERTDRPGKFQPYCKSCFSSYCVERWKQRKIDAIAYKGGECQSCKGKFHYSVYDFHHIEGKDANWNKMRLWSWDRTLAELDRCHLLCANCHRIEHYS